MLRCCCSRQQNLEPGQRVILLIASANRDPREFDAPDEFRWNRKPRRMLSFGVGPHFCIGIHLARLEGAILIEEFLAADIVVVGARPLKARSPAKTTPLVASTMTRSAPV